MVYPLFNAKWFNYSLKIAYAFSYQEILNKMVFTYRMSSLIIFKSNSAKKRALGSPYAKSS